MYYSNVSALELYRVSNIIFTLGYEPGELDKVLRKHYTKDEIQHINGTLELLKQTEANEKTEHMKAIEDDIRETLS